LQINNADLLKRWLLAQSKLKAPNPKLELACVVGSREQLEEFAKNGFDTFVCFSLQMFGCVFHC
jgi:hypothetical protein